MRQFFGWTGMHIFVCVFPKNMCKYVFEDEIYDEKNLLDLI